MGKRNRERIERIRNGTEVAIATERCIDKPVVKYINQELLQFIRVLSLLRK